MSAPTLADAPRQLLTLEQLAADTHIPLNAVKTEANLGRLPTVRIGRRRYTTMEAFHRSVAARLQALVPQESGR